MPKTKKIDRSWAERFCRECAYFDKAQKIGKYYSCIWTGNTIHGNMRACEDFLNKNVVQKEVKKSDICEPKEKKMEEKLAKLVEKKCYKVQLEVTQHSTPSLVKSGIENETLHGNGFYTYVFADSFEEVGRRFPAAISIEILGPGYVLNEDK